MAERIENHYCGMLVIRKEQGFTSSDVVAKLRGIVHMRRIGHTGTLDPMAEGVLPVCLGNATKLAELIADRDKEYLARLRLGVTTDTQDMTGTILTQAEEGRVEKLVTEEKLRETAQQFTGEIDQIPPMYSAVWSNGRRLYELAREGIEVERKPRRITISELEIVETKLPFVTLRVVCSKGTYMDSDPRQLDRHIIPVDSFFREAPAVHILSEDMKYLRNGNALSAANTVEKLLPKENRIRVYDEEGTFYALYRYVPGRKRALPVKMFHDTDSRENDRK